MKNIDNTLQAHNSPHKNHPSQVNLANIHFPIVIVSSHAEEVMVA